MILDELTESAGEARPVCNAGVADCARDVDGRILGGGIVVVGLRDVAVGLDGGGILAVILLYVF